MPRQKTNRRRTQEEPNFELSDDEGYVPKETSKEHTSKNADTCIYSTVKKFIQGNLSIRDIGELLIVCVVFTLCVLYFWPNDLDFKAELDSVRKIIQGIEEKQSINGDVIIMEMTEEVNSLNQSIQESKTSILSIVEKMDEIRNIQNQEITNIKSNLSQEVRKIKKNLLNGEIGEIKDDLYQCQQNLTELHADLDRVQKLVDSKHQEADRIKSLVDSILLKEKNLEAYNTSLLQIEKRTNSLSKLGSNLEAGVAKTRRDFSVLKKEKNDMVSKIIKIGASADLIHKEATKKLEESKELASNINRNLLRERTKLESFRRKTTSALQRVKELSDDTARQADKTRLHQIQLQDVEDKLGCLEQNISHKELVYLSTTTPSPPKLDVIYESQYLIPVLALFIALLVIMCCQSLCWYKFMVRNLEEKVEILKTALEVKNEPVMIYDSMRILYHTKSMTSNMLLNKYCIISFNQDNVDIHTKYIKPCLKGRARVLGYDRENYVVQCPTDVKKIPRCKVVLVFVDKNPDNMILETPGKEDDDLRLLTVKVCQKFGADVFVIYVGDEGSEKLMPRLLYSPQIAAVTEHFLLKKMEVKDRVMTCNKELTVDQREKISEKIN